MCKNLPTPPGNVPNTPRNTGWKLAGLIDSEGNQWFFISPDHEAGNFSEGGTLGGGRLTSPKIKFKYMETT